MTSEYVKRLNKSDVECIADHIDVLLDLAFSKKPLKKSDVKRQAMYVKEHLTGELTR